MRKPSIEKLKEINLVSFSPLLKNGFNLIMDEISISDIEKQIGNFMCIYESHNRIFTISYNFKIINNNRNKKFIESTNYQVKAKNIEIDNFMDISQYLRIKRNDIYDRDYNLFNDSDGIQISEYSKKVDRIAEFVLTDLAQLMIGNTWISASHTRLDGFKIIENGKTEYY